MSEIIGGADMDAADFAENNEHRRGRRPTHGHACRDQMTPEYRAYRSMITRCTNSNRREWKRYGGRGITVCERWRESFAAFFADLGPRPSPKHSLDRFPNKNGNYEPGNVRWATTFEQANNKGDNHILEYRGEQKTMAEWAKLMGISLQTLANRINRSGWTVEKALTMTPRHNPVEFRGQKKNAREWARELGLRPKTVEERLRRGWSVERALTERPTEGRSSRPQCARGLRVKR